MVLSTFLAGPELNHVMADMVHYSVAASVAEILLSFFYLFHQSFNVQDVGFLKNAVLDMWARS